MQYTVTGYSLHGHPILTFYSNNSQEVLNLNQTVVELIPSVVKLTVQVASTVDKPRVTWGWNRCNGDVVYFDGA